MGISESEAKVRGCERKKGYDTVSQARRAAAYVWSQTGTNLKVYQCRYCKKYHLTHKLDFTSANPGYSESVFVSSPNFTGNRQREEWDRNDLELREQRKAERAELMAKELEAMRPTQQVFSDESKKDNPDFAIDQEKYITGKNRYKHKIQARDKINRCIRCNRPIEVLDASRLCEVCRGER